MDLFYRSLYRCKGFTHIMFSKMKPSLGRTLLLACFLVMLASNLAFSLERGEKYLDQATRFLDEGYDLQAIMSYRNAISAGFDNPSIRRDIAFAYYNLGMLDDAINNMEAGVAISLRDPIMLIELGILYGARGNLSKSISVLKESLGLDPSQGDVYIYLGLALLRQGNTKLAWQAARIAEKLHQNPLLLMEKLQESGGKEPKNYPFEDSSSIIALRQITLGSVKQGENLIAKWEQGASLTDSFQGSTEVEGQLLGGYIGTFTKSALKPEIFDVVRQSKNYDLPTIVQTNGNYLLVQRIWPFDPQYWIGSEEPKETVASGRIQTTIRPQRPDESSSKNAPVDNNSKELFQLVKVDPEKIPLFTGSFQQREYAVEQLLQLRKMGFLAYYQKNKNDAGGLLYNVIAGEFVSVKEVLKAKALLKKKGYDSFYFKK